MIHSVRIPRTVRRLGVVTSGSGGNAGDYQFDATGLSKDPRLAWYLQDLTPAQLQAALNGEDPSDEVRALLEEERTGTGRGWLPCGTAANPTCGPADTGILHSLGLDLPTLPTLPTIPTWVWLAGGGVIGLIALRGLSRR